MTFSCRSRSRPRPSASVSAPSTGPTRRSTTSRIASATSRLVVERPAALSRPPRTAAGTEPTSRPVTTARATGRTELAATPTANRMLLRRLTCGSRRSTATIPTTAGGRRPASYRDGVFGKSTDLHDATMASHRRQVNDRVMSRPTFECRDWPGVVTARRPSRPPGPHASRTLGSRGKNLAHHLSRHRRHHAGRARPGDRRHSRRRRRAASGAVVPYSVRSIVGPRPPRRHRPRPAGLGRRHPGRPRPLGLPRRLRAVP